MSDQDPGPSQNPYGGQSDPYGQPQQGSPYGQQPSYGSPAGQPYGQQPYGQPSYGQPAYGQDPSRRPGTVTAAAWITIVLSALTAGLFGLVGLAMIVARDQVITEMQKMPEVRDSGVDPEAALGASLAIVGGLAIWAIIAIVLAIFVLRRSNVSRILLVISSAVVVVLGLLGIASVISAVWLIGAVAVIVLLFVGGAGDWFKGVGPSGAYGQPGSGYESYGSTDYPSQDYPGR
ncbi:hypothetical protein [Nocardioides hwasunensis]|uniref:DUF4064 domain-containing protein n=1 Tax=Nocardioides hwasunensis TaxID=397258 RepID=A0ABR8MRY8_9ACTN|nr:hypothetical protein [Nocardioides hwasunensis]MBD3916894.1 hypothetical protein [Nocardioides hwasunensis]